jgi:hypothetical protein
MIGGIRLGGDTHSSFLLRIHGAQEEVHVCLAIGLRGGTYLFDIGLREL